MQHIKNIKINNFRGITQLELVNLKPITILVGENSMGKSTILESMFMITGPNNPFISMRATSMRVHGAILPGDMDYIFHDTDYSIHPCIEAEFTGNCHRRLRLVPLFDMSATNSAQLLQTGSNTRQMISGLTCMFDIERQDTTYSGNASLAFGLEGKFVPQFDNSYQEQIESVMISPEYGRNNTMEEYDNLVKMGKKENLLQALCYFDARINTIESTRDGLFIGYRHLRNLVPLSMAGDGIRKYLRIALQAFNPECDIIFIDEIENGLHFTAHSKLWECIITSVADGGKQFIITTHNKETLSCLASKVKNNPEIHSLINVITLAAGGDDDIAPYYLSGQGLYGAITDDVEFRQ